MYVATLIADSGLDEALLAEAAHDFDTGCIAGKLRSCDLIDDEFAGDLVFEPSPSFAHADCAELAEDIRDRTLAIAKGGFGRELKLDVIVQRAAGRRRRLLVADMDSTMIGQECIDELADYAGLKAEIAAITERAMQGELDFEVALEARVALLAGLDEGAIERCLAERVTITPGARALVRTMKREGARTLLVSGGFDRFADRVAGAIGFDSAHANRLGIASGRLDGTVARPIVGADAKREALVAAAGQAGIPLSATLAVGDGANDMPMVEAAGLGVAYHAKPALADVADARIVHNDLSALLYAQGYPRASWEAE